MIATEQQRFIVRGVWVYLVWFFILTGLSWVPFFLFGRTMNFIPSREFPERFGDLAHFASVPQKLANAHLEDNDHTAGTMFPRNYGPVGVLLYLFLLGVCSPYGIVVFLVVSGGALFVGSIFLWRAARGSPGYRSFMVLAIFGTSLLGSPTADALLGGNLEGLLWIGYAAGIGLMCVRRWGGSASVLGIASCIKPYPALLLILLLWRRKYSQFALGCVVIVAMMIGSSAILGKGDPREGLSRIHTSAGSKPFFPGYIVGFRDVREAALDHSLFQTSKSIMRVVKARGLNLPQENYRVQESVKVGYTLLAVYVPVAALFLVWVLWRVRKKPFLTQVFSLSICLTLLPLVSSEYTLTILYVPMGLFFLFLLREVATGRVSLSYDRLLSILVPCALLVAPQTLFGIWKGDVKSIILLCLLFVVMGTSMPMGGEVGEGVDVSGEIVELGRARGV